MKMKYEIKNRFTNEVIFSIEAKSFKDAVKIAVKQKIDLSSSNLSGSNLRGSNLSGSNLRYSNLSGSNLRYSNLSGSNLRYSNLRYSNLRYSDLRGSNLRYSDLSGSNLSSSNLSGSDLRGSNLSGSNLRYSDLSGSNLSDSNLSGSDLSDSDLSGSDLSSSDLSDSDLSGSNLSGSDLSNAIFPAFPKKSPTTYKKAITLIKKWFSDGHWIQSKWIDTPDGAYSGTCKACLHGAALYLGGKFGKQISNDLVSKGFTIQWNDDPKRKVGDVTKALNSLLK